MPSIRSIICGFTPIKTSLARPPFPSTQALVARVVDSDRYSALCTKSRSSPCKAVRIPSFRSPLVVSVLLKDSTLFPSVSRTTASVQVPPVSIPIPIILSSSASLCKENYTLAFSRMLSILSSVWEMVSAHCFSSSIISS